MSKTLDWNAVARVNFDDNRRKATGSTTYKEQVAKGLETLRKSQEALKRRQEIEPILKSLLVDHMVNRRPIKVENPIQNPTETLGGLQKGEEDDGFYHSGASPNSENLGSFQEVMETIPAGTELVFKAWDKQMGQWIFKSNNGNEYAIYEKSVIIFNGNAIENPGLYGLLFNTHLV